MQKRSLLQAIVLVIVVVVVLFNLGIVKTGPPVGDGPREVDAGDDAARGTGTVGIDGNVDDGGAGNGGRVDVVVPDDAPEGHGHDEEFVVDEGDDGHHHADDEAGNAVGGGEDDLPPFEEHGHDKGRVPAPADASHILQETGVDTYSRSKGHLLEWYKKELPSRAVHRDRIVRALHLLGAFLDSVDVPYFVGFGTLLGVWREGGFIEHDHDGDIFIAATDLDRLREAVKEWTWPDPDYQIIFRIGRHAPMICAKFADSTTGLYVDVWLWWEAEARGVSGADTLLLPIVASGPKTKSGLGGFDRAIPTPRDKVFPLNRCTFEHFEVWCPADPHWMLHATYRNPTVPH